MTKSNTEIHELTISELEAVTGGNIMGLLDQVMQTLQKMQNPAPPPQGDPAAQQFQQILNGLNQG